MPISASSAYSALQAWSDFVPTRVASEEGQWCKLLTCSLPLPLCIDQRYLHVFPADVWYDVEKSRSYRRSWHNWLNSKARPLLLTPHWVTQYWTLQRESIYSSAYLFMSLSSLPSREQGNLWVISFFFICDKA